MCGRGVWTCALLICRGVWTCALLICRGVWTCALLICRGVWTCALLNSSSWSLLTLLSAYSRLLSMPFLTPRLTDARRCLSCFHAFFPSCFHASFVAFSAFFDAFCFGGGTPCDWSLHLLGGCMDFIFRRFFFSMQFLRVHFCVFF